MSSAQLPRYHPDQPDDPIPPYAAIPDEGPLDQSHPDELLPAAVNGGAASNDSPPARQSSTLQLPRLVLGCATFGDGIFAASDAVRSDMPARVVRLALRSGMTAFDTAPWYHPSEIILGHALSLLAPEFPRSSYKIITKVGKYGPVAEDHTFEPDVVKKSVQRSLRRLKTDYLDAVYLHDVEFVASSLVPPGNPLDHLPSILSAPPVSLGEGDDQILRGVQALRDLQSTGVIKYVGIAAYPLPLLLRIALLVLHSTGRPLDVVQTYAHQTLANSALSEGYLDALVQHAKVGLVVSASPLGMGLLTKRGLPEWHPARTADGGKIVDAVQRAVEVCEGKGRTVEDVACEFGYRKLTLPGAGRGSEAVPIVVGCKSVEEVHASLKCFVRANDESAEGQGRRDDDRALQEQVQDTFEQLVVRNWSWQSPLAN